MIYFAYITFFWYILENERHFKQFILIWYFSHVIISEKKLFKIYKIYKADFRDICEKDCYDYTNGNLYLIYLYIYIYIIMNVYVCEKFYIIIVISCCEYLENYSWVILI